MKEWSPGLTAVVKRTFLSKGNPTAKVARGNTKAKAQTADAGEAGIVGWRLRSTSPGRTPRIPRNTVVTGPGEGIEPSRLSSKGNWSFRAGRQYH